MDAETRRLSRGGEPVPLSSRLFEILLTLIENRGELVSKGDLMRRVWAEQFVEESNLTVSISMLRKALGESHGTHEFIETVARRGYRFVARLREVPYAPSAVAGRDFFQIKPSAVWRDGADLVSLAVLPITDGGEGESEYLPDGITESLINRLSQLPRLKVMARSTVFRFKGRGVDSVEVGRYLGVQAVLTGTLLEREATLSISLELVNVADGSQLWGAKYERPVLTLLTLHEEIAQRVAEQLKLKLGTEEKALLAKANPSNATAHDLYLKGRYCWNKYGRDWVWKGIRFFERAIEADPTYAPAHAGLADSYQRLSAVYMPPKEALPKAAASARRAVELDDSLAEAHLSLGMIESVFTRDLVAAEREFKRAIELNSGSALVHQRYGAFLAWMGRFDEGVAEGRRALELDPLSFQVAVNLSTLYQLLGRFDESVYLLRQTIELAPNFAPARVALGSVYTEMGNFAAALEEFRELARLHDDGDIALGFLGHCYGMAGLTGEARDIIRRLEDAVGKRYVMPYSLALVHAGLGETEAALKWLNVLYEDHNDWLLWLKVAPELKGLRGEPRFNELLRRIGFPADATR